MNTPRAKEVSSYTYKLIDEIQASRSTVHTLSTTTLKKQKNYVNVVKLLQRTTLYKAEISFKMPGKLTELALEDVFNTSEEKISEVKNELVLPKIKLFTGIGEITNKLATKRAAAYSLMSNCKPFGWVVMEEHKDKLVSRLEDVEEYFSTIPEQIAEVYQDDFRKFLIRCAKVAACKFKDNDAMIQNVVARYSSAFPMLDAIISNFDCTIFYPEKLPQLSDVLDEKALFDRALQREEAACALKSQQAYYKAISEGIEYAQQEMLNIVKDMVSALERETVEPGNLTNRTERTINNCLERMSVYLNWDNSLQPLYEKAITLQNTALYNTSKEDLSLRIQEIRQAMLGNFNAQIEDTTAGHRRLPKSRRQTAA